MGRAGNDKTREELEAELASLRQRCGQVSESEEITRVLMEAIPAGVIRVDTDGSITMANDSAAAFLGLELDPSTRRYDADFRAIDESGADYPLEDCPIRRTLRDGKAHGPTVQGIVRSDQKVYWGLFQSVPIARDGQVRGAMVTIVDITARRIAEEKLRASESRLWSYLESSPAQILFVDQDLRIQFVSRISVPGRSPSTVRGKHISEFMHPDDRARVIPILEGVLETGDVVSYDVAPYEGVYDSWYAVVAGPVRRNDRIVGVVLNITDVSDRVELQSRLLVADRLASQGTMAASVAHEINNPLTYVMANLSRLSRLEVASTEPVKEWIAGATEGVERIRNVVRDLSSLSGSAETPVKRIAIRPALESAIRMARSELQHRAQLVTEFGETPPVRVSESGLGQVFLNIVVNAAQAIPVGDARNNRVEVRTRTGDDGWAVIEIADTGKGLPADLGQRIFEPFVTTKEASSGTGLGLYISSTIVRSLGGRLGVEPNRERGSLFRIELPPGDAEPREHRISEEMRAVGTARILVIDDEERVLEFMRDALSGHEVSLAQSGREALEALDGGRFDLVFCDLIMPEVSGMDVYDRVRGERPEQAEAFVFMTGGAFTPRSKEFLAASTQPLLEKPFSIDEILGHVGEALARG